MVLKYIICIFILLLIIIILYYMVVSIHIKYKKCEESDLIIFLIITGFGLIKYKLEIPYLDFFANVETLGTKCKMIFKSLTGGREFIGIKKIETVFDFIEMLKKMKINHKINSKLVNYLIQKIKINNILIKVSFGLEDAFKTAIIYGILCAILTNILALLNKKVKADIEKIEFTPIFNKDILEVELSCIIVLRLGYIITGIKMMKNIAKGSVVYGTTYSSINENNPREY